MAGDVLHILVTARCSNCRRVVSAPYGEVKETGLFGCICGTITRARCHAPAVNEMFAGDGWADTADAYPRSG